jgi:hypothetical protein
VLVHRRMRVRILDDRRHRFLSRDGLSGCSSKVRAIASPWGSYPVLPAGRSRPVFSQSESPHV